MPISYLNRGHRQTDRETERYIILYTEEKREVRGKGEENKEKRESGHIFCPILNRTSSM